MKKSDIAYFRKEVKILKEKVKTPYPFSVRIMTIVDDQPRNGPLASETYGYCDYSSKKKKFNIGISKKLSLAQCLGILIHELAHCISWQKEKAHHGKKWGIAYSKIYRICEKYVWGLDKEDCSW